MMIVDETWVKGMVMRVAPSVQKRHRTTPGPILNFVNRPPQTFYQVLLMLSTALPGRELSSYDGQNFESTLQTVMNCIFIYHL